MLKETRTLRTSKKSIGNFSCHYHFNQGEFGEKHLFLVDLIKANLANMKFQNQELQQIFTHTISNIGYLILLMHKD